MNKSDTPTKQKVPIPLRLPPILYQKMVDEVQRRKKESRGYSINQFLTDLISNELENEENE